MEQVFIGFGTNQGHSIPICSQAIEMLDQQSHIYVPKVSSLSIPVREDSFISCSPEIRKLSMDLSQMIKELSFSNIHSVIHILLRIRV
jgi:7,8-dihydro-6-hydroxymethylpterin-pyrophosphokinase